MATAADRFKRILADSLEQVCILGERVEELQAENAELKRQIAAQNGHVEEPMEVNSD